MRQWLAVVSLLVSAGAGAAELDCYRAAYWDNDGDGYAMAQMPQGQAMKLTVSGADRLSCPSGWVREVGDCDDFNPNIHPRRAEVGFNGLDDNCNMSVDEPAFVSSSDRAKVSASSVTVTVALNNWTAWMWRGGLNASVAYTVLSEGTMRFAWLNTTPGTTDTTRSTFVLSGLPAASAVSIDQITLFTTSGLNAGVTVTPLVTTTDGTTSEERVRTNIVLRALNEVGESDRGAVGYRGTVAVNGTRYGASVGDYWCSEFYGWSNRPWVYGYTYSYGSPSYVSIAGYSSTVSSLEYFFSLFGALRSGSSIPTLARRGDYLAISTGGPDDDPSHSGMFLAYDPVQMKVWSVEGNVANHAVVTWRPFNTLVQRYLGHLDSRLLH